LQQDFDLRHKKKARHKDDRALLTTRTDHAAKDGNLEFIHIPKNAGTSVENAGQAQGVDWGAYSQTWTALNYEVYVGHGRFCPWVHVPPAQVRDKPNPYNNTLKDNFCVTRDPYDKMVSEYTFRAGGTKTVLKQRLNLNGTGVDEDLKCTAEGLNLYLKESLHKYKDGDRFYTACHFLPQSEFVWGPDGHQWCDIILRLEEFPEAFDDLMESRRSPVRLLEEASNPSELCANVSSADLNAEVRALIDEVYYDDFVNLNYSFWLEASS